MVRAPAAPVGSLFATVSPVIGWAPTVTAVDLGCGVAGGGEREGAVGGGVGDALERMVTAVLAAIVLPLLSQHSRLGSVRREQKPTVVPATMTSPPVQLARLVLGREGDVDAAVGGFSVSAPVAEVVNAIV